MPNKSAIILHWLLGILLIVLSVLVTPLGAFAADTKLGNYEEAPYKDIVEIYDVDFKDGLPPQTYVKIPEKYIFSTDKLHRNVTIDGREWEDLVIVSRYGEESYLVFDMFEHKGPRTDVFFENLKAKPNAYISKEQLEESIQKAYQAALWGTIDDFLTDYWEYPFGRGGGGPIEPIVSINGRPWQETEWKDYIIKHIRERLYPSDPLVTNKQYWEVFLNPKYNGRAKEVIEAMEKEGAALTTTEPVAETGNQVVLTLGKKEVLIYREGQADVHTLDVAPEAPGGVTMVPLRGVLDFLGAKLDYDGPSQTVVVEDGNTIVKLKAGENIALINEGKVSLLRPAEVKNGRILIPLRFVGENLGYQVTWDPEEQQITIKK
jgi:hypothetical protein